MAKIRKETVTNVHKKSWGIEVWIENCSMYCGKLLDFSEIGKGTSMHFHMKKTETMFVHGGKLLVELIDPETATEYSVILNGGDKILILPGQSHRLTPLKEDTLVFEFSTEHFDDDSYRVGPRNG